MRKPAIVIISQGAKKNNSEVTKETKTWKYNSTVFFPLLL